MSVDRPGLNLGVNAEGLKGILPEIDINTGVVNVGINNNNHDNTAIQKMTQQMGQGSQNGQPHPGNGDVHNGGERPTNNLRAQNNGNGNNGNQGNNGNETNVSLRTNNGNQETHNNGNNGNQGINNNGNGNNNGNNGNHYGWYKNGNNGNGNGNGNNGNVNFGQNHGQNHGNNNGTVTTPPIFQPQNQNPQNNGQTTNAPPPIPTTQNPTIPGKQNPVPTINNTPPVQTPPIFENQGNQKPTTNQNFPQWEPILIINTRLFDLNLRDNVLRSAVNEVLRQNDIYVSRDVVNSLIGNQNGNGNNRSTNVPNEVRQLVQSILNQVSNTLNNSTPVNPQIIRQVAAEMSNNFQPQINLVRDILIFTTHPGAKHFSQLNIQERVFLAVELMMNHLSSETNLQQFTSKEIYNGLMLARGMITSGEHTADIRNLIALRGDVLQNGFSPAGLRDLGQLVKGLVVGAANANTSVNLDAAVQKFIKILLANNELGVLLSASMLGKQSEHGTITMNRTLALVQIYQLIARLIIAGEAALKELASKEASMKNAPVKNENNLSGIGLNKITDADEKSAMLRDLQNNNLHNNLKNFLEFNPSAITDRSASSFVNPDDARHAQNHFSMNNHDEIEQWLSSGNHRFVKEIDLEKPIGVVVERGADDFFPAAKARIVLVRDSSPQGWHFLKSFLVR